MPQPDRSYIRKGLFMHGGEVPNTFAQQPLCHVYKQQRHQQPTVSLEDIAARIEAVRKKVEALRATIKRP